MGQLSFFSVALAEPRLEDLGGLLAAHGQALLNNTGARVSILLADQWRAEALVQACRARELDADILRVDGPATFLVRTERRIELLPVARAFTRGAVKSIPENLQVTPGWLWCWAVAAGREDGTGYLLGMDPHAPDTHERLLEVCARAGLAGTMIGIRGGGPGVRIVGHRRLERLVEILGEPPTGAPPAAFPSVGH
ncbi:hypothetical protein D1871_02020 [Nakamurella silvestris]|nr:hypothetical protein D1871_02020 [Nakamurella silvestris]